jgi:hypothetical protein
MADETAETRDIARSEDLCATCAHPRRIHGWGSEEGSGTPCDGSGIFLDQPCACGQFAEPPDATK